MLGPSGVGVLYVAERARDKLGTLKLGGGTVDRVHADSFALKRAPYRFEAGTPNIEGVLGLAAAVRYLERIGMDKVAAHEAHLARLMEEELSALPSLTLLGPRDPRRKIAIAALAPTRPAIVPETLGMMLSDSFKVMARAGMHCAHPYFERRKLPGAVRLSAYVYTTDEDVRTAAAALRELLARL
jgi:cysteine desulfurase/selenocysteine lyase